MTQYAHPKNETVGKGEKYREKDELFEKYAGRYRLVKFVIGGADRSEMYANGWTDKSLYMYFEITAEGQFCLKAHAGGVDKEYKYYLDPLEMKYYLKEDHSDAGTRITIEGGILTDETDNYLMVYERTDELD